MPKIQIKQSLSFKIQSSAATKREAEQHVKILLKKIKAFSDLFGATMFEQLFWSSEQQDVFYVQIVGYEITIVRISDSSDIGRFAVALNLFLNVNELPNAKEELQLFKTDD